MLIMDKSCTNTAQLKALTPPCTFNKAHACAYSHAPDSKTNLRKNYAKILVESLIDFRTNLYPDTCNNQTNYSLTLIFAA